MTELTEGEAVAGLQEAKTALGRARERLVESQAELELTERQAADVADRMTGGLIDDRAPTLGELAMAATAKREVVASWARRAEDAVAQVTAAEGMVDAARKRQAEVEFEALAKAIIAPAARVDELARKLRLELDRMTSAAGSFANFCGVRGIEARWGGLGDARACAQATLEGIFSGAPILATIQRRYVENHYSAGLTENCQAEIERLVLAYRSEVPAPPAAPSPDEMPPPPQPPSQPELEIEIEGLATNRADRAQVDAALQRSAADRANRRNARAVVM